MNRPLMAFSICMTAVTGPMAHAGDALVQRPQTTFETDVSTSLRPQWRSTVIERDIERSLNTTDSSKIYEHSEQQRSRLTDPKAAQAPLVLPGAPPKTTVPSGKIYGNSLGRSLGLR